MENATNGLLMAGSVLIGVIVISLFVYLITTMGGITKNFQEEMDLTSVQKFNEQFEKYIGRTDINTHEMLTIYNLCEAINNENGEEVIKFKGITIQDLEDKTQFLSSEKVYQCKPEDVQYSNETGKILSIQFKEYKKVK